MLANLTLIRAMDGTNRDGRQMTAGIYKSARLARCAVKCQAQNARECSRLKKACTQVAFSLYFILIEQL